MAALKTRITPARRRPPKRIPASAAVVMEETIALSLRELGGASGAPPRIRGATLARRVVYARLALVSLRSTLRPPRPPARSAGVWSERSEDPLARLRVAEARSNPAALAALSVVLLAADGAFLRRLRARGRPRFGRALGARRRLRLCARRVFGPAPLGPAPHLPAVGRGSRALPLAFGPAQ